MSKSTSVWLITIGMLAVGAASLVTSLMHPSMVVGILAMIYQLVSIIALRLLRED